MKEKDIQRELKKYLDTHPNLPFLQLPFSLETKLVKDKRFPFNTVREHQIQALLGQATLWKFTDVFAPTGNPTGKKPFDFLWGANLQGYLGVCFYIPRKQKITYFVKVQSFLKMKQLYESRGKKSIKEEELQEYSDFFLNLLKK